MRPFRDISIRQKLMIAIVGTSGAAVFLASAVFVGYQWLSARYLMTRDLQALAQIVATNSTAALSFNDANAARDTLSALKARPDIRLACIYASSTGQRQAFASYDASGSQSACPAYPQSYGVKFKRRSLVLAVPILLRNEAIGALYIVRSLDDLWYATVLSIILLVLVLLFCILIAFGISAMLQRFIAQPIMDLALTAHRVSHSKDYSIRAVKHGSDEVGRLIDGFNDMLMQIGIRDRVLKKTRNELEARVADSTRANAELQQTLARLQTTQEQLVTTEKMASLGELVAGVAHEINTPLGVGVTAASTLQANSETLNMEFEAGSLTKSGLQKYVQMATLATKIILTNLNRASELIQSFKQVAVDQTSSESRRFVVKTYINEILMSLRPKLKNTHVRVEIICDDKLEIESNPGALSQVLTNLVMNSLIHAYDEDEPGIISIDVERMGGNIRLRYRDDGKGIPKENLTRVFDPFFTTRRGFGGSGLGMHIVYNLVTQQLGGKITLSSELHLGTTIEIVFPSGQGASNEHTGQTGNDRT